MTRTPDLAEYLAEIRTHVCSRCIERPPGGPPCAPQGKICGVEAHLPELVDAIHQVDSVMITAYVDKNRHTICEHCAERTRTLCPCPMDYLAVLLVEAVETVDARYADAVES